MYLQFILLLLSTVCKAQYIVTTSVDNAGNTYWSPTAGAAKTSVQSLPTIPTLVYNCAIVPALCNNVAQLRPGAQNGGYNEVFGWDPDSDRKEKRREKRCPGSWKKGSAGRPRCPSPNQPQLHPLGISNALPPVVDQSDFAVLKEGANGDPERTGLMMTCDEFPPAMSIQGGKGPKGGPENGVTYCVPMSFACSSIHRDDNIDGVPSEQNWQSMAHSFLGAVVGSTTTDIWTYSLQTVVLPPTTNVATFVRYTPKGGTPENREYHGSKRDLIAPPAAVFGILHTGAHLHLDIPHGHTAEQTIQLHEQLRLSSNYTIARNVSLIQNLDTSELLRPFKTARRLLKAGKPKIQGRQRSVEIGRRFATKPTQLPNSNTTLQQPVTLHGPTHQDPQLDPPLPILQIGLEYMLQDASYSASNNSLSRTTKRQSPKKSCGPGSPCADGSCCNSDGQCGYGPNYCTPKAPVTCLSNCDAAAMCGKYSAGGAQKCGLNLCCSFYGWCGTTENHCVNSDPLHQTTPCQAGFGGCQVVEPPSCGGATSGGRKIAYYQSWNVRQRRCQRISPRQIKTDGLTHLYFAFATIDPTTFAVGPLNPADPDLYLDFTALKSDTLKTWIAIGGFDFSNPDATTHTTWSDMVSTQANRAAFITSLVGFMDQYGFQGADLDWEYPTAEVRGGKPEDTENLIILVKEMRAALGSKYGLSSILAPDYWYLRGMDPKAMEPYVDWFGFMAYDLHGSWDAAVKTIGALVRPQTDLRDITNDTLPLWFDKLDPAKVNLGLAYYGRGYTLSDKACNYMGCSFSGPSKPAACTNFEGVMSNREIKRLIKDKSLTPTLIDGAQVKQITWDDQWIGYDDDETFAAKVRTANSLCMGGTMIWSIDFDSGSGSGDVPDDNFGANSTGSSSGGGNNPGSGSGGNSGANSSGGNSGSGLVYVDPSIWTDSQPLAACEPPCVLVLPPMQLPSPTVISFPPVTTTYVVSSEAGGAAGQGGTPTLVTVTTAIAVPPVTTTEIQMWAITIFTDDPLAATFTPVQSVEPHPVIADFPGPPTKPQSTLDAVIASMKSHQTTIYPQATHSVDLPPRPAVSYTRGPPKQTCTAHCGHHDCKIFGCGGGCSLFGCGGNCGLLGCGGGCGIAGCGGGCGIQGCGGCGLIGCGKACPECAPNIDTTGGDTTGGDEGDNNEDDNEDEEDEDETKACLLEEADLATGPSPADGIIQIDDVSAIPGYNPGDDTPTPTPSQSYTTLTLPTVTLTVTPTPSPQAVCTGSAAALWYNYQITNMMGTWVEDGGGRLHDEVSGCGDVTKWQWTDDEGDGNGASVTFRTPATMKKGCVGRAIGSAGGPKVDC